MQELGNRYVYSDMGLSELTAAQEKIVKEYGVLRDEKGRYYTLKDKKYRKMLEEL